MMSHGPGLFEKAAATLFIHRDHVLLNRSERNPDDRTLVSFSHAETIHGPVRIFSTPEGIFRLDLLAEPSPRAAISIPASWQEQVQPSHGLAIRFLNSRSWDGPPIPLCLYGTEFQHRVWRTLLDIPCGHRTTYGSMAATLGDVSLSRAVGTAVGSNPVAVIIPCHRVVAADGKIGEFRWGAASKKRLLSREAHDS